ncbi:NAD(P)/FAD-dependent oxidoreductase [Nitrosospira multiformis]|uniref:Apoptosis-inducing factor, C-term n=1 Tax=Nitrosospira multiformis (strain ATCC 25196 / NCIMB 11849 / C 71) TaxID=323848 RepID=Q2YC58_NITMU|nr:FAD-dependent oxidoreductase [Nitrosospira multiformis]ABB73663.1 FAD-dependent pyridine nucleotide-disulfide oxidoreductase [Nitrosospira multiformis ATCC 25196]SDZ75864.1 Apoptosis-inducing factor, C-term [Nitrosospira multiformis]SEF39518.1 Apoptosis-inducing factor, C-term [Nitrosospira multiformis ATCC 25196]
MKHHKYLIVGGGMTADSAVHGIRKIDPDGAIAVIGEELHRPYNRPPLSKALWKDSPYDSIWRSEHGLNVAMHLGKKIVALDPANKTATDNAGNIYTYEKLLLATGGEVRRFPHFDSGIIYYRTADDYLKLRELSSQGSDFVVIGGGFIGSEIAAALAMNDKRVTMIFPENGISSRIYPRPLVEFLNSYYREKGVIVLAPETVTSIRTDGTKKIVTTGSGTEISADGVVAGLGILPNTELAVQAGLAIDNGIVVDEFLRTSNPDIYAAGDVANFYSPLLDKRMRVEHEDNANMMGEAAGRNMAGSLEPYHHQPFFYSDLFDLGYEAVGELDSSLDIVEDWVEPFRKGVIYYLRDELVRGVLLWNTWGQVDAATALIAEKKPCTNETLLGRIKD